MKHKEEKTAKDDRSEFTMASEGRQPSEESLRKNLEIQWQDHFQTRVQTWKALEITALMAVAIVGLDWQVANRAATVGAATLLFIVAGFGALITLRHRMVEIRKFHMIADLEDQLGLKSEFAQPPAPIHWYSIFLFWKSNTPLFILRMFFIIQLFGIGYAVFRLFF